MLEAVIGRDTVVSTADKNRLGLKKRVLKLKVIVKEKNKLIHKENQPQELVRINMKRSIRN